MSDQVRPLSPHLQIYRLQINSVLSIAHRLSGVVLMWITVCGVLWILTLASGLSYYEWLENHVFSLYGKTLVTLALFTFFYHMINGIRHFLWDFCIGLSHRHIKTSGLAIIFLSITLTSVYWFFCFKSIFET